MSTRNLLIACCGLSLLLFFFPLQVVVDRTGAQQSVLNFTGYDAVLRLADSMNAADVPSDTKRLLVADWFTPLAFLAAFGFAAIALFAAAKNKRIAPILCVVGLCLSVAAIVYTGDLAVSAQTAEPLPPPGLARDIVADIVSHVEKSLSVEPGWAGYGLAALLGLGALFGFLHNRANRNDDAIVS